MKLTKALVGAITLLLLMGVAVYWLLPHEPAYGGRSLSSWLQDMDGYAGPKMTRAKEAIQAMDTNAVPFLTDILRLKDSRLEQSLTTALQKLFAGRKPITPLIERHRRAVYACEALGPKARAAIPDLSALLYRQNYDTLTHVIAFTLVSMGPDAVPYLTNALTSTNAWVRANVAGDIGRTADKSLAPLLLNCLKDTDGNVRASALQSYSNLEANTQQAVSALVEALRDPDERVQSAAAYWLDSERFGKEPQAKAVVPLLLKALGSGDPNLRRNAARALARFDPQTIQAK